MTSGRVWTRLPTLRLCATREGTCASIGAAAAVRALTSTRRIPAMKEQFSGHGVEAVLEHAQQIAGHASPKTTKLYDRTADTVTVDEIERIVI